MAFSQFLMTRPLIKPLVKLMTAGRTKDMVGRITRDLPAGSRRICDIGCGPGQIARALQATGLEVTGVDMFNFEYFADFTTLVYDGQRLPFADNSFDVALLITVLHHCPDPSLVLKEALRIAPRLIVIEDVVRGPLHAVATKALDSVFNLEFVGHPHNNKTDDGWLQTFADLGVKARRTQAVWDFGLMWQVSYLLERP